MTISMQLGESKGLSLLGQIINFMESEKFVLIFALLVVTIVGFSFISTLIHNMTETSKHKKLLKEYNFNAENVHEQIALKTIDETYYRDSLLTRLEENMDTLEALKALVEANENGNGNTTI